MINKQINDEFIFLIDKQNYIRMTSRTNETKWWDTWINRPPRRTNQQDKEPSDLRETKPTINEYQPCSACLRLMSITNVNVNLLRLWLHLRFAVGVSNLIISLHQDIHVLCQEASNIHFATALALAPIELISAGLPSLQCTAQVGKPANEHEPQQNLCPWPCIQTYNLQLNSKLFTT